MNGPMHGNADLVKLNTVHIYVLRVKESDGTIHFECLSVHLPIYLSVRLNPSVLLAAHLLVCQSKNP